MTPHHCHAEGCTKDVPPKMLMCRRHWAKVPRQLQRLVWRHYRIGQEISKAPSAAYMAAQRLAVASVAAIEKKPGVAADVLEDGRRWAERAGTLAEYNRVAGEVMPAESAQPSLFGG